jgi:hypothetical protein
MDLHGQFSLNYLNHFIAIIWTLIDGRATSSTTTYEKSTKTGSRAFVSDECMSSDNAVIPFNNTVGAITQIFLIKVE